MKRAAAGLLVLVLTIVGGPTMAQDDPDASFLARAHWSLMSSDLLAEVEAMDCDELADELDSRARNVLTHTRPDWLSPDQQYDWSALVADYGSDFTAHFLQVRLALVVVISLEKHCGVDVWGDALAVTEDDLNASELARSHWAVDAEHVTKSESHDCDTLAEAVDMDAGQVLSLTQPDWLSPGLQQDWSKAVAGAGAETTASALRARLALFAVLGLEKQCYPPAMETAESTSETREVDAQE
jgi:hypothetical protein